jgi:hypothetical protein
VIEADGALFRRCSRGKRALTGEQRQIFPGVDECGDTLISQQARATRIELSPRRTLALVIEPGVDADQHGGSEEAGPMGEKPQGNTGAHGITADQSRFLRGLDLRGQPFELPLE